jgi:hypothetical protein
MKKLLIWRYNIYEDFFSGAILIENSEYDFWLELLKKQETPFEINLNCSKEVSILFNNGQELINSVEVKSLDIFLETAINHLLGNGIGILNFYTDVVNYLDNDDFIIDMSDDEIEN